MTRVRGWERRLREVVERHRALPFEYGRSDCFIVANDAVEAVTGSPLYAGKINYSTAAGAAKKLLKHGFRDVEEAFASRFECIPVAMAQRGDIGVIHQPNGDISGGVFTGVGFLAHAKGGARFVPSGDVTYAFRVE